MLNCWARIETNVYNRKKGFIKFIFCPKCICLVSRSHLAHILSNQQFLRAEQTVKVSMAVGWSPWQMFCHGLGSFFPYIPSLHLRFLLSVLPYSAISISHKLKTRQHFLSTRQWQATGYTVSMHSVELHLPSISLLRAIRK